MKAKAPKTQEPTKSASKKVRPKSYTPLAIPGPVVQVGMLVTDASCDSCESDVVKGIVLAITPEHVVMRRLDDQSERLIPIENVAVFVRPAGKGNNASIKREPFGEFAPCAREKLRICVDIARVLYDLEFQCQSLDNDNEQQWEQSRKAVEESLDMAWADALEDVKMINNP